MFDENEEKEIELDLSNQDNNKEEVVQINVTSKRKRFDDLRIKYRKNKKKYLILMSAILAMLSMTMGSSYAYLTYVSQTDNTITINAGTLALTFRNEENVIRLLNTLPVKDQVGLEQEDEYSFKIKNNGTIPAKYVITLDDVCETGNGLDLCIPDEYIKVGIKVGTSDYKVVERNDKDKYVIETGSLEANGVQSYKMKLWLAHNTPDTYNAKSNLSIAYKGKLGLSYEQGEYKKYVYRSGLDYSYPYNPLAAGTYTGYCYIDNSEPSNPYNSCSNGWGFITESSCNTYIANQGYQNATCQSGVWTVTGITYTEDATSLNKQFYLRYTIGSQTEILESYVCYMLSNNEYCLRGGDRVYNSNTSTYISLSYESNKQILDDSFGSSNCTDYTNYYECSSGSLDAKVYSYGLVRADDGNGLCEVDSRGSSNCSN